MITNFDTKSVSTLKVLSTIALVVTLAVSAAASAQSGQSQIDTVQALVESGKLDEALEIADLFIAENPGEPRMRFLKGLILTSKSRWQDAIDVFRSLANDFPELPAPLNNLAVAYAEIGEYDRALETLKEALQINPGYASAHENLGDIYVTLATLSYQQAASHKQDQKTARAKLKVLEQLIPSPPDPAVSERATSEASTQTASASSLPPVDPVQYEEIATLVNAWAAAWSSQDVDKYLGYYSDNFLPNGGQTLDQWRSDRRYRVMAPAYIRVKILNVEARIVNPQRAQATITQRYESNTYQGTALKDLHLERQGDQWKIVQEIVRRE